MTDDAPPRLEAAVAAAPLVTVLALAVLRKGAFFRPDIVMTPALAVALAVSLPEVRDWLRAHLRAVAAGAVATGWWILDAALSHPGVDSWRLPSTWLCLAAAYACARALPAAARTVALAAVTAAGCALAIAGLALIGVRSTLWTLVDERSLRYSGPFTYPSAVGLFLVTALIAGTDCWPAPRSRLFTSLAAGTRAATVLGIVATDSRGAVLGLAVALCFRSVRNEIGVAVVAAAIGAPLLLLGQRTDGNRLLIAAAVAVAVSLACIPDGVARLVVRIAAVPAAAVVGWLLLTQHHAVSGLDASWTERGNILRGAATVFRAHPWFGAGPDPRIRAHTLTGHAGIAYFTHNEPVEVLISVGLVGAVVLTMCVIVVVRPLRSHRGRLATPVLASAAIAGLVDFVWHFPALGMACGIVAGAGRARAIAFRREPDAGDAAAG
jgi:O-antigen ligase